MVAVVSCKSTTGRSPIIGLASAQPIKRMANMRLASIRKSRKRRRDLLCSSASRRNRIVERGIFCGRGRVSQCTTIGSAIAPSAA